MNNTAFADTIEKLQTQGLETLKQAQAAQIAAVNSVKELVNNATSKIPSTTPLGNIPAVVTQINELNASYAVKLIEQQNDYVNQLVSLFKSVQLKPEAATEKTEA
jgi:hypothetical protein